MSSPAFSPFESQSDPSGTPKFSAQNVNFFYGQNQALHDISIDIPARAVTAFIGPSGCGKSTFLRCFNRMNDTIVGTRMTGKILLDGQDIHAPTVDVVQLRTKVGMVFQKPMVLERSIFENVVFGPKLSRRIPKSEQDSIVQKCLTAAALWPEVKDKLNKSALELSGGQQQRLCIARALAIGPDVILMDEPCSALDPVATARIEDLIEELKASYTIVIVTHNMQQAQRASDYTGFFLQGHLMELNKTESIFLNPTKRETEDYISGRFG